MINMRRSLAYARRRNFQLWVSGPISLW